MIVNENSELLKQIESLQQELSTLKDKIGIKNRAYNALLKKTESELSTLRAKFNPPQQ